MENIFKLHLNIYDLNNKIAFIVNIECPTQYMIYDHFIELNIEQTIKWATADIGYLMQALNFLPAGEHNMVFIRMNFCVFGLYM